MALTVRYRPLPFKSCEPLLELSHAFLECFLLRLLVGTCSLRSSLLVMEASTDLRTLFGGHLGPDPAGAFDFVANAVVSVRLLLGPGVFGGVAERHG